MKHEYTKDLSTEKFEIKVSPLTSYGYFEHNRLGDECGGGLWFDGDMLVDYDGVSDLPRSVEQALRDAGYYMSWDEA